MRHQFISVIIVIGVLFPVIGSGETHHVVLAAAEFPPYSGEQLANYGEMGEIIIEAYRRVGYDVTIKFYPWARALQLAKDGKCDGLIATWHSPEREEWFAFSDPLAENQLGFYKRVADPIELTTLEALKPYQIGIVRGYTYPEAFEQASYLRKQEVKEDLQNLKKLASKRIDLAVIDHGVATYLVRTVFPESQDVIEWMEPPLKVSPLYLAFSKQVDGYQQKRDDFHRGFEQLRQEGLVDEIRAKHGL